MTNELASAESASPPRGRRRIVFGRERIRSGALRDAVRSEVPMLREDRRQDFDIERVVRLHHTGALPCPPPADVRPSDA